MSSEVVLRTAARQDEPALRAMLALAFAWDAPPGAPGRVDLPEVGERYVAGFGRPGDRGVVAVRDRQVVGGAWYRLLTGDERGYGHVTDDVPELSLAVAASERGRGLGSRLLAALLDEARSAGLRALSLSVDPGNPALRLYERAGFRRVGERDTSWTLLRELDAPA